MGQICTAIEAVERDTKSKNPRDGSGKDTQSDEKNRNAFATDDNDNCKSTQDAAMEEMKRKQNAFLAQMEEDTDDESESDSNSAGNSSSDSESITDDEGKSDQYDRDKLIQSHTVKGKIQTDNCNDTCIFCHEVCGNKLYGYVGFSFQPASNASRFAISCCPHVAHIECLDAYLAMQNGRANHAIDTTNNAEFLCPLCKRLSNILVPAIPYAYEKITGDKQEDTMKHALSTDISVTEYSSGLEAQITEKIKFRNGGAEAELLRFISTISNKDIG